MAESERLHELQQKFNENPRRYFAPLANELRKRGDYSRAIDLCRTYLPHLPGHMSGFIVYGQSLFDGEQYDEAVTAFNDALNVDPENVIALRHLGDIARIQGDAPTAIEWYQQVLEFDPKNEEISAYIDELSTVDAADEPPSSSFVRPPGWFSPDAVPEAVFPEVEEIQPDAVPSEPDLGEPVVAESTIIASVTDEAVAVEPETSEDLTIPEYQDLVWVESEPTAEHIAEPDLVESDSASSPDLEAEIDPEVPVPTQFDDLVFIDYSELDNSAVGSSAFDDSTLGSSVLDDSSLDNSVPDDSVLRASEHDDTTEDPDSIDFVEGVSATVAPFATETLANLYMDQGLYQEALTVLKQLAVTRSVDDPIFNRIADVEERLRPEPTVREFFSMIGPDDVPPTFHYIGEL